jgi:hypothetical protein
MGSPNQSWSERHLRGWRFSVLSGSILAFTVLILNICVTSIAMAKHGDGEDSQATLFDGNCEKVRKYNVGLHLVINVLSTILLGASNYGMQCLSAPTRADVNLAHTQGKWLDIGVFSIRNITRISKKRAMLWILLGMSSLPLHLLYVNLHLFIFSLTRTTTAVSTQRYTHPCI